VADNNVDALATDGTSLYVTGVFATLGGQSRTYAGALSFTIPFPGNAPTAWNPSPTGQSYTVAYAKSRVYLGGSFGTVGGDLRVNTASIAAGGTGTVTSWAPNPDGAVLALATGGTSVYLGGSFAAVGAVSAPRAHLAAVDATTGAVKAWNPDTNGSVIAIAVGGQTVFIGGTFSTVGGIARARFAAIKDATLPTTPLVKILGKRNRSTTKSKLLIKGTAKDYITTVSYRVGKTGAFKKAVGTATWHFTAKLKPGKNTVTVVAAGEGGKSVPTKITVTRK
jgi:hypothetical protein